MFRRLMTTSFAFVVCCVAACENAQKTETPAADATAAAKTESKPTEAPKAPEAPKPAEAPKAPAPAAAPTPAPAPAPTPATAPAPAVAAKAYVQMTTSKGDMIIELDRAKAPVTVDNFLVYVKKGQYDGTVFHRVIKDFMIQGGGFDANLTEKPTDKPIKNEGSNGLSNRRGTIAMARTNDPNSATAQFYINVVDNPMLDTRPNRPGYAVFGTVIEGMDVADQIRAVQTGRRNANTRGGSGPMGDVPLQNVEILKVVEISAPAAK